MHGEVAPYTFRLSIYAQKRKKNGSLMADKEKEPPSQSKSLTESDSSDDNEVNPRFKTSVEESNIIPYQDQLQPST